MVYGLLIVVPDQKKKTEITMKSIVKFIIIAVCICVFDACRHTQKESLNTERLTESESEPITLEALESSLSLTVETIRITDCFGGITVTWENVREAELGILLMVKEDGGWIEKEKYFSKHPSESRSFRGFPPVKTTFALTLDDQRGNVSDTVYYTGTPFFETEVRKPWKDLRSMIPYDNTSFLDQNRFEKIWDGIVSMNHRYVSGIGSSGSSFTFDFGQRVKLNRMTMWPSWSDSYSASSNVYGQAQILEFEMWGTPKKPEDLMLQLAPGNESYWSHRFSAAQNGLELPNHTFLNDWVYLGYYAVERLDQLQASQYDIRKRGEEGHQFEIPSECGPVRIIRFFPISIQGSSPPINNYWQIAELSFWGDNTVP